MDLKGKKVLITGAAKRVGRALAIALSQKGALPVLHYWNSKQEAEELQKSLKLPPSHLLQANLENEKEVFKLADQALSLGPIDILINSASTYYPTPFTELDLKDWDKIFNINLKSIFILSQKLGLAMKKQGRGRIINIADTAATKPYLNYLPYCTSKGALLNFTKALALELAPEVSVNVLSPGPIAPPPEFDTQQITNIQNRLPLKKWGGFEEVAKGVIFFCESDFTTGDHLTIDGGALLV